MQPDGMATGCGKLSAAATAPGRPDAAGLERPRAASQTGRVISAISIGCPVLDRPRGRRVAGADVASAPFPWKPMVAPGFLAAHRETSHGEHPRVAVREGQNRGAPATARARLAVSEWFGL